MRFFLYKIIALTLIISSSVYADVVRKIDILGNNRISGPSNSNAMLVAVHGLCCVYSYAYAYAYAHAHAYAADHALADGLVLASCDADGILRLTLNAPGSRNALSEAMMAAIAAALEDAASDDAVRVIVLAANGPVFCAGRSHASMLPPRLCRTSISSAARRWTG